MRRYAHAGSTHVLDRAYRWGCHVAFDRQARLRRNLRSVPAMSSWSMVPLRTDPVRPTSLDVCSVFAKATAVQNPLTSLADDVAATRRILALQEWPTVLVGNSWAGTVSARPGLLPTSLPDLRRGSRAGCRRGLQRARCHVPDAAGQRRPRHVGRLRAVERGSVPQGFRQRYRAREGTHPLRHAGTDLGHPLSGKTTQAAWRSKPSWYAIAAADRTISPELQRFMANG